MNIPRRLGPLHRPFTLSLVGLILIAGAVAAGFSALHYEFYLLDSALHADPSVPVYQYSNLPEHERGLVDAAIDGNRIVAANVGALPGAGRAWFGGRMAVERGDTVYVFARQPFFAAFTLNGLVTIALPCLGVTANAIAFSWDRRA